MWLLFLLCSVSSFSESNYQELRVKDYEEMERLVSAQVALSRKAAEKRGGSASEALEELKKGLVILFMHPQEGTNNALLALLKTEIISYTAFWRMVLDVVRDSIEIFQSSFYSVLQRASHLYVLENVLTYIKNTNEEEFNQILSVMAKARIEIPREVTNHRFLNVSLGRTPSPSAVAANMLNKRIKEKKEKDRREALEKIKRAQKEALQKKQKAAKKKASGASNKENEQGIEKDQKKESTDSSKTQGKIAK